MPHWPHFQRHFRCNLRQECAGGEDEVQCPYSPCSHGGVSFQGHCYFFTNCGKKRSWLEAHKDCREAGGYMASLTTAREWGDVNTWLSLDATWRHIFVGLTSVSPRLPHMCVENGASSTCSNFLFAFPCVHSTNIALISVLFIFDFFSFEQKIVCLFESLRLPFHYFAVLGDVDLINASDLSLFTFPNLTMWYDTVGFIVVQLPHVITNGAVESKSQVCIPHKIHKGKLRVHLETQKGKLLHPNSPGSGYKTFPTLRHFTRIGLVVTA